MRALLTQAVQALSGGQLSTAEQAIEAALAREPDSFDALHIGGVIAWQCGDEALGRRRLEQAISLRPADPEPHFNLGSALLKSGQFALAREAFLQALERNPDHVPALNNLGTALSELGHTEDALKAYLSAIDKNPAHVGALHNAANLELQRGRAHEAGELYHRALALQPTHAGAMFGMTQCLLDLEQNKAAVELAGRAVQSHDEPRLWNALGLGLARCEQFDLAIDAYGHAIELDEQFADVHNNLASAYVVTENAEQAEHHFLKAIDLDPKHPEAWGNLAAFYELSNRLDEARAAAESGLEVGADQSMLRMTLAKCARRGGDLDDALAQLKLVSAMEADLPIKAAKELHFELGTTLDKLGRSDQAFDEFVSANRLAGEWWYCGDPAPDSFVPALKQLSRYLDKDHGAALVRAPQRPEGLCFLLGFARSGTTLLDTMLGAHPDIEVLEEPPTLSRVIRSMTGLGYDYPSQLDSMTEADLSSLQQVYFEAAEQAGAGADKRLLIDKNPLSTAHIPLICTLFPTAKIVLAIRHPYDVVLSCFMQDFAMNAFMTHFLSLESAADVYVKVMALWQRYVERFELDWHQIRYEDLVADRPGTMLALFRFLDLDPSLAGDYQVHARDRGLINTPSYHQVSQPIYQDASYRWKRYEPQLASIREQLRPFAQYFGYSEA